MEKDQYGLGISEVIVPVKVLPGFLVHGENVNGDYDIPLATVETPLWPSTNRGKKATVLAGGIETRIEKDEMTRSLLFYTSSVDSAERFKSYLDSHCGVLEKVANSTTRYGKLTSAECLVVGNDVHYRMGMFCGDASGHNMTTNAALEVAKYVVDNFQGNVALGSLSSNACTDKKVTRQNVQKGRGKHVVAECVLSKQVMRDVLHTTPKKMEYLNFRKNVLGTMVANYSEGFVDFVVKKLSSKTQGFHGLGNKIRDYVTKTTSEFFPGTTGSENAHHANIVAAVYLATGQDIANVVGGSTGSTIARTTRKGDLEFRVELPTIIVGTVGHGKTSDYARKHLEIMGCLGSGNPPGSNAKKLAELVGAAVLAGELSLMAALTNNDELMRAHKRFER